MSGGVGRSLISFTPQSQPRWPVALQAALTMAIPIAVGTAFGHEAWGLQASMGGFVGLYLVARSRRDRLRGLPFLVAAMSLSAGLGVLLSGNQHLGLAGLWFVAVVSSVAMIGFRVGPPGPIMVALVYGATNQIAAPIDQHGAGVNGFQVWGLLSIGAVFAYLVAVCPLLLPSVRRREGPASRLGEIFPRPVFDRDGLIVIGRMVAATTIAVLVVLPFDTHRGYWIVCAGLAILSMGVRRRLGVIRGMHRVIGTLLGLLVFVAVVWLDPQGYWLALTVLLIQAYIELMVVRHYALALLGITPVALLLATAASHISVQDVAIERATDTVVGAAIAMLVLLLSGLFGRRDRRATSA